MIKLCATQLKIPFTFFIPTSSQRLLQVAPAETLFYTRHTSHDAYIQKEMRKN